MQHFFKLLGKLFHNMARCKKSFVSNNWRLVWTGSAFPQCFLSCKQSDAERKYFVDIQEQGHSWFYTSLRLFVSFVGNLAISLIQPVTFSLTYSSNYSLDPVAAPRCFCPCTFTLMDVSLKQSLTSSFAGFAMIQHCLSFGK